MGDLISPMVSMGIPLDQVADSCWWRMEDQRQPTQLGMVAQSTLTALRKDRDYSRRTIAELPRLNLRVRCSAWRDRQLPDSDYSRRTIAELPRLNLRQPWTDDSCATSDGTTRLQLSWQSAQLPDWLRQSVFPSGRHIDGILKRRSKTPTHLDDGPITFSPFVQSRISHWSKQADGPPFPWDERPNSLACTGPPWPPHSVDDTVNQPRTSEWSRQADGPPNPWGWWPTTSSYAKGCFYQSSCPAKPWGLAT
ncbi:hypothetical protein PGT21_014049 [Puccinia graminis f. sp. tritici]|uniref:Uncharacterized protein n=1 Tax=Puccinia graminis f. sp. tritici TaxID=56615 RepID=A0A5B0P6D4_PUCGR|nr:hypothetical protein PGT21_014049 [Puccinia graminis f. sp. tritici]